MKKFFAMAAFAALTLAGMTSCSNDDYAESAAVKNNNVVTAMRFNVTSDNMLVTRGTPITAASGIGDFEVWGYYTDAFLTTPFGLYVGTSETVGTIIDGDGAGNFGYHTAADLKYWPATDYPLVFTAMSPAQGSSGNEITAIANAGGPTASPACNGKIVASITVPTTVANQKDIMFAQTSGLTSASNAGTADLTFNHALAQVVFRAKVAREQLSVDIASLEIVNVKQSGTAGYADGSTLTSAASGDASQTFGLGLHATNKNGIDDTDPVDITAADGALMLLPQTVAKWTTTKASAVTTATADGAHNSYLKILCTVTNTNDNSVVIDNEYIYVPFEISWTMGNKYIYTLIFGSDESNAYDENGDPITATLPITYAATVAAWTNAWDPDTEDDGDIEL